MKIVFVSNFFSQKMGYVENALPKAIGKMGHEVHLIASNAQIYFDSPFYAKTYEPFLGPPIVPCGEERFEHFTLHRLPHEFWMNRFRIKGLPEKIFFLQPDIVQTFEIPFLTTFEAAIGAFLGRYKLFLESHIHASVFSSSEKKPWLKLLSNMVFRIINYSSQKCYAISKDCAEIAKTHFKIHSRKMAVCSLGVCTDIFHPPATPEEMQKRTHLRGKLGFSAKEIVCIYSGRFSTEKNPECLARAIKILQEKGLPFRGLFIGGGSPSEVERISRITSNVVVPFVPFFELVDYYQASDLGVWPCQESTSQLDALACGLPVIISDNVQVLERIEGTGATYRENDPVDLATKIKNFQAPSLRKSMGELAAKRIAMDFSWDTIARQRIISYQKSLLNL